MPLRIVTREEWGSLARPTESDGLKLIKKFKKVFVMNCYTRPCEDEQVCQGKVKMLQERNWSTYDGDRRDLWYNFLVGGDGNVYEGRGWNTFPKLPRRFLKVRNQSMLIGFLGDYTSDTTPDKVEDAASELIKYGIREGYITPDYLYYDLKSKREDIEKDVYIM